MQHFEYEEVLYLARISEQGERYDEMIDFVKELLNRCQDLGPQERHLLSISFKNSVNRRRSSLRMLDSCDFADEKKNINKAIIFSNHRKKIASELKNICEEAISIADWLLSNPQNTENSVFLYKIKADYNRYICEYDRTESKKNYMAKAEEFYLKALDISYELSPANPTKLGLILNLSVFYYEVEGQRDKAVNMAAEALEEGLKNLEFIPENYFKDASAILQLFRENLSIWSNN